MKHLTLLETLLDGLLIANPDGKIRATNYTKLTLLSISRIEGAVLTEVNQVFLDTFGFKREEMIGQSTIELGLWSNPSERVYYLERANQGMRQIPVPLLRARTRAGEEILLRGSFNCFQIDGEAYSLAILENITEQRRSEIALTETQALLRAIVDSTPDLIWSVDPRAFGLMMYNRGLEDYFLRRRGMQIAVGMRPEDLFPTDEYIQKWRQYYRRALEEGPYSTVYEVYAGGLFLHLNLSLIQRDGEVVGISVFGQDISDRVRAEAQLTASLQQQHALSAHLQTIREEERARIAREIHDELGQALTGMKMDLFWLKSRLEKQSSVTRPILNKLSGMLLESDQIINAVRRISTDLRPSILDTLGLAPAIDWLTSDFQSRYGITCQFETSLQALPFSQSFATSLFRICQEALTNVARHAGARRVTVRLTREAQDLLLTIEDDGKGIPSEQINRPETLGILGMKERARSLNGRVEFERRAAGGTCVSARFPKHFPENSPSEEG